jgi:hypothetical protein
MQQNESFGAHDAEGTEGSARFGPGYARALGKIVQWVIITPNTTHEDPYSFNGSQVFALGNIEPGHKKKPIWKWTC